MSLSAPDHSDVEDEESTPVSPPTPDNAMNLSVGPASESANFINVNPEVHKRILFYSTIFSSYSIHFAKSNKLNRIYKPLCVYVFFKLFEGIIIIIVLWILGFFTIS